MKHNSGIIGEFYRNIGRVVCVNLSRVPYRGSRWSQWQAPATIAVNLNLQIWNAKCDKRYTNNSQFEFRHLRWEYAELHAPSPASRAQYAPGMCNYIIAVVTIE